LQRRADLLLGIREQAVDLRRRDLAIGVLGQFEIVTRGGFELVFDAFELDSDRGESILSTGQYQ
jgi:hypothetical protein